MSFEHLTIYEDEDVDLSLDYAQCWGVERCKNYDGYSIPVRVNDERVLSKLKLMSSKYKDRITLLWERCGENNLSESR